MSDESGVEQTAEAVAYRLMYRILAVEKKNDRKSILDTYAECLQATQAKRFIS